MNTTAHQTRYHKPPRRQEWDTHTRTEVAPDQPCPRCGNCVQRITEKHPIGGPARPASMGPDEYQVFIDCNACDFPIEDFWA